MRRSQKEPKWTQEMRHSGIGWVQLEVYFCLRKRDLHEFKVSKNIRQMKRDLQGLREKRLEEV